MPPSVFEPQRVVFAAMSKRSFYLREYVIKYVLERGFTPTCAFMMYSYFLLGTVEQTAVIRANNELIRRSDELWVFGAVSHGVKAEVDFARKLGQQVSFFIINEDKNGFIQIDEKNAEYE